MRFCCRRFAMSLGNGLDVVCDHAETGDPVPRVYLMYGDVSVPVRYCPWCGASTDVEVDEAPCECTGVTVAPADVTFSPADEPIAPADEWGIVEPSRPDPATDFDDMLNTYYRKRDGQ